MSDYYVGEIRMFAGTFAPVDWHLCDGTLLSISTYQVLYSLVGTIWGGDGRTTFGIPDLRGRVPLGQGTGTGLTARTLGQTDGAETVALTDASQLPSHTHTIAASTTVADMAMPGNAVNLAKPPSTAANYLPPAKVPSPAQNRDMDPKAVEQIGSGLAHNNMMQSFAVTFIICVNGLYPQRN